MSLLIIYVTFLSGPSHRRGYEKSFLNQSATLYYTGAKFPSTIALQDLHYFVPYIKGKGIRDVYEIVRMRTITGKEAKQEEGLMQQMICVWPLNFVFLANCIRNIV